VLLVMELLRVAKGAECISLLELIAKSERENRWKKVMGATVGTCMRLLQKVTGKKMRK
jgi:hypothetical protein